MSTLNCEVFLIFQKYFPFTWDSTVSPRCGLFELDCLPYLPRCVYIDLECASTSLGWPPNSLVSTLIWDVYLISQVSAMTWCMHAQSLRSCPTVCNPMDHSPPGSSVHGIFQARILESIPMPSSRGSSRLKTEPVSCIAGQFFTAKSWEKPYYDMVYYFSVVATLTWCVSIISKVYTDLYSLYNTHSGFDVSVFLHACLLLFEMFFLFTMCLYCNLGCLLIRQVYLLLTWEISQSARCVYSNLGCSHNCSGVPILALDTSLIPQACLPIFWRSPNSWVCLHWIGMSL